MFNIPLSLLSPAGSKARLSILIFHRVLARPDPLFPDIPDVAEFERKMSWVRRWFNVLPLADGARRLADGSLPARAMAITFDDGYADNEELAAPILKRLGLSGAFFVSTGFLGDGCMWNDRVIEAVRACPADHVDLGDLGRHDLASAGARRAAIDTLLTTIKHREQPQRLEACEHIAAACGAPQPPRLMMTPEQVKRLRTMGMEIGGHTVTHPILARTEPARAAAEIGDGKRRLEAIIGEPIELFAYPNGVPGQDYGPEHVAMVRDAGFTTAVSTSWGAASRASDRFQLPRFTPWDRDALRYGTRLVGNLMRPEKLAA